MPKRRCYNYHSDGTLRRHLDKGDLPFARCPPNCAFVHPEDTEWNQLIPNRPPLFRNLTTTPPPMYSRTSHKDSERDRDRDWEKHKERERERERDRDKGMRERPRDQERAQDRARREKDVDMESERERARSHSQEMTMTKEENGKAWFNIVTLLGEWLDLKDQSAKIAARMDTVKLVTPNPTDALKDLNSKLEEADKKVHGAQRKIADAHWPNLAWMVINERAAAQYRELQDQIDKLNVKLPEIEKARKVWEEMSATDAKEQEDRMDVDGEPGPSSGSRKRRRLSLGPEDARSVPADSLPSEEVAKSLEDAIQKIAERVSSIENIENALGTELRDLVLAHLRERDEAPNDAATPAVEAKQVTEYQGEVDHVQEQLEELSELVAELREDVNDLDAETQKAVEQQDKDEQEIKALQARIDQLEQDRQTDEQEIAALSAAITAYKEAPVSPPDSPLDPQSLILDDLESEVKRCTREVVGPIIDQYRDEMQRTLQEHDAETYRTLWGKLAMVQQVITAVSNATKQPPAS